ncbi:MAG: class I tRNA ligase family protein [Pirellulaceae bacterium]
MQQLAAMARGVKLRLPLLDREIRLVADEWAKPELGSGCVKITPCTIQTITKLPCAAICR